jgi:hypothetical protein
MNYASKSFRTVVCITGLLLQSCLSTAETVPVVSDGRLMGAGALEIGGAWPEIDGSIQRTGGNRYLFASRSFKSGEFKVKARLTLKTLGGSEASFIMDTNMFGFDSRKNSFCKANGALYLWGPAFLEAGTDSFYGKRPLGLAKERITPGKPFDFEVACDGQTLAFYINSKPVVQIPYKERQAHSFGFMPHRGTMRIHEFSVTGTADGKAKLFPPHWWHGNRMEIPAVRQSLAANRTQTIALEIQHKTAPGAYQAQLVPAGGGKAVDFELKLAPAKRGEASVPVRGMEAFYMIAQIEASTLQQAFRNASGDFATVPFLLTLRRGNEPILQQHLLIYDPTRKTDFPQSTVATLNGAPTITVNKQPLGTIAARLTSDSRNPRFAGKSVRDFGEAGIRGHILQVRPAFFFRNDQFDLEAFMKDLDTVICQTVASAPDALIWLDWQLYMPQAWCNRHPEELIELEDKSKHLVHTPGGTLQPSYASELWKREAGDFLATAIGRMRRGPWADRLMMIRTSYGNAGEWNHWGYKKKKHVDFSAPMQKAFAQWLKAKYKTDRALRRAWDDTSVSLSSLDLVPRPDQRMLYHDIVLRKGPKAQRCIDYYDFFQYVAVKTIEHFGKVIKKASGNRLLSGAYYGYYLSHLNHLPYHLQDSGHYGLKYYLRSKYLDFLSGPYPYHQRKNRLQINGLFSSIALHNKVWLSENDQRTHLSNKAIQLRYGATDSVEESIAIAKRDYMVNFSKQTSYYFFDFIKDWFVAPTYMQAVARLEEIDGQVLKAGGRSSRAQVAVLFSEESISRMANSRTTRDSAVRAYQCALRNMLELQDRTGAPWDIFLVSDMDKIDFSPYRLVIFANSYRASDKTLKLTRKKLFRDNKTILFLGTPGIFVDGQPFDLQRSYRFSGIKLKLLKEKLLYNKLTPAIKSFPAMDLTKSALPREYWLTNSIRALGTVNDPVATALAYYDEGKEVAVAKREFRNYRTILYTALAPPQPEILRAIFREAGVHIYLDQGQGTDSFYCAGDLLALYSRTGGQKTIVLPEKVDMAMDLFTGKIVGKKCRKIVLDLPKRPTTVMLFAGPAQAANAYRPTVP